MSTETSIEPKVNPNQTWKVNGVHRLTACENRQSGAWSGKVITVTVLDKGGKPLQGVKVRFDVESSSGIAYDRLNVYGPTDENGRISWKHLGIPTQYELFMEGDEKPLIESIRTDLGYLYCKPPGSMFRGWRPTCRPGIYSYRIEIQKRG